MKRCGTLILIWLHNKACSPLVCHRPIQRPTIHSSNEWRSHRKSWRNYCTIIDERTFPLQTLIVDSVVCTCCGMTWLYSHEAQNEDVQVNAFIVSKALNFQTIHFSELMDSWIEKKTFKWYKVGRQRSHKRFTSRSSKIENKWTKLCPRVKVKIDDYNASGEKHRLLLKSCKMK